MSGIDRRSEYLTVKIWTGSEDPRPASLPTSIIGGVLGGLSHSLIDSIIYTDFHPFAPFSVQNPLHGLITPNALSYGLLLTGVIGLVLLAIRALFVWRAGR